MKVSDEVRATYSRDGAIILDVSRGQMFRLNLTGSRIFELLEQGHSEEEIADRISQQFTVKPELAMADLRHLLKQLEEHRLVDAAPTATPSR